MKKIMFNDKCGLTQAVLEGRKTQTRRIIPSDFFSLNWDIREDTLVYENEWGDFLDVRNTKYSKYKVGEIVAVAQSYNSFYNDECNPNLFPNGAGWTNKRYAKPELMPHRIRITAVSVERLRDISDIDCMSEGINYYEQEGFSWCSTGKLFDTPREAYASLIDKISGKGTWESNPWCFVYDFELVKKWE